MRRVRATPDVDAERPEQPSDGEEQHRRPAWSLCWCAPKKRTETPLKGGAAKAEGHLSIRRRKCRPPHAGAMRGQEGKKGGCSALGPTASAFLTS